jgi:hypothetical protein
MIYEMDETTAMTAITLGVTCQHLGINHCDVVDQTSYIDIARMYTLLCFIVITMFWLAMLHENAVFDVSR